MLPVVGLAVLALADPVVTHLPIPGARVTRLATDGTTMYAGTIGPGLYTSSDGGATWSEQILPGTGTHQPTDLLAGPSPIVCEDSAAATIVTGTAVTLSGDGLRCFALARSQAALYAGIFDADAGQLYKSIDAGASWQPLAGTIGGQAITEIVVLPTGRLVVATRSITADGSFDAGAILTSDDDGMTFQDSAVAGATYGLAFNGSDTLMAFVGTASAGAMLTSPDGTTWTSAAALPPGTLTTLPIRHRMSYDASADVFRLLFALTNSGISKERLTELFQTSTKAGGYALSQTDKLSAAIDRIVADVIVQPTRLFEATTFPDGPGVDIFAGGPRVPVTGFASQRVRRAFSAGGMQFALGQAALYNATTATSILAPAETATVDITSPTRVVASGGGQIVITDDITAPAWTNLALPLGSVGDAFPALLANGQDLFVGVAEITTHSTGQAPYLSFSLDRGASWQFEDSLDVTGGIKLLAFDPSDPMTMFAGAGDVLAGGGDDDDTATTGGLFRSIDGGATWDPIMDPTLMITTPLALAIDGTRVWALVTANHAAPKTFVFASSDGGVTWTDISPNNAVHGLAFGGGKLFVGSSTSVLASTGDASWQPFATLTADVVGLDVGSGALLASTSDGVFAIAVTPPVDGDTTTPPGDKGCCDAGGDAGGPALVGLAAFARRRRRYGTLTSS